jgi:cytochrome c-type biogenesis protein CcmH
MMWKNAMLATLGVILLAPLVYGQEQAATIETEAKHIETLLIAPCCWRQPISDHQSQIAEEMKVEIRQFLKNGRTRQQILDHYVDQYGPRILSIPPQEGFNRMSFLMPVFFAVIGLFVVGGVLRKWQRQSAPTAASAGASDVPGPVSDELTRRIQKELDEMD